MQIDSVIFRRPCEAGGASRRDGVHSAVCSYTSKFKAYNSASLKRQSDLWASFAHLTQNFTGNSMVVIIFVKNVGLRNGTPTFRGLYFKMAAIS